METIVEGVDISITTIKNELPQQKPVAGKFIISKDCSVAVFKEEENATVIIGERQSKRIMQGKGFNLSFNPEKNIYRITLSVDADKPDWNTAVVNFTNCWACIEEREGI